MLNITRYGMTNPLLQPWVKFIWHLKTESPVSVNHKLLPSDSIDIILNLSDQIEYLIGNQRYHTEQFHVNGMRDRHGYILQKGQLNVFGISFYPFGLYPVFRHPLTDCTNQIISLEAISETLYRQFATALRNEAPAEETVRVLEDILAAAFDPDYADRDAAALLADFCLNQQFSSISGFCSKRQIHVRTFERLCLKYAGYPPKTLQRISRFQRASRLLIDYDSSEKLTELAYETDYYDQAHFIRDFFNFSGTSPGRFIKEKNTVKANTNYTYR